MVTLRDDTLRRNCRDEGVNKWIGNRLNFNNENLIKKPIEFWEAEEDTNKTINQKIGLRLGTKTKELSNEEYYG